MYIANRGSDEVPFGFVYTDDESARAAFAIEGDTVRLMGPGSGYFERFSEHEMRQALRLLATRFNFQVIERIQ